MAEQENGFQQDIEHENTHKQGKEKRAYDGQMWCCFFPNRGNYPVIEDGDEGNEQQEPKDTRAKDIAKQDL